MRIVSFTRGDTPGVGLVDGEEIVLVAQGGDAIGAIGRMIAAGAPERERWVARLAAPDAERVPLATVRLEAPLPEPRQMIVCVGKNYRAHATEFHASGFDSSGKEEVPSNPVVFAKAGSSVVGAGAAIRASLDPTRSVDYEGELAVVIGRRAFQVAPADAMAHVFGYTIVNDVTSRELQSRHSQWLIGKSLDSFGPMGPWIVTADEIDDLGRRELVTRVNDEIRQKARLADLIFDIPTLITTLSATMTLEPGDVIATGTPAGVGIGFKPPRYLQPGDRVAVSIEGLGTLENPVT
ncbi:fumarylacetoacetate hydrolase family protein [Salinarimonas rosea]|uniref:fumarylacetoacetate hydrolase family protein n=1 Tax=Salinarimonas rosea TaxID=552063 RepID=UPI00040EB0C1|nr:fumarylacetoacetate hydrolase family protein [Salinarimonas rosea]